ncbi:ribonuclease G [Lacticaseibacillus baoqingensis]|uniref:Ribonuclease G n=1 Tax=Lacticaseibacillus baoqingensis TaxID=2486013 RepID=A0ABW4E4W0_9LACO|nr:ribonuclease G [Lacticaseibacillus baoqingensis]
MMKAVPEEIKHWNWGAFSYNIFWGIGNKCYLPLLMLIPVFNLVWVFVCGAKGNEWAWQNGDYTDVATFNAVQATWSRAGLVRFLITAVGFVFVVIFYGAIIAMFLSMNSHSYGGY